MRTSKRRPAEVPSSGTITSLVAKGGGTARLVVYLDGARAFELATAVADAEVLRTGSYLSAEGVGDLLEKDAPYRARERALGLLALRDRSRHEIETRLQAAGFASGVTTETIASLQDLGYLDDERFASHYVTEKLRGGWGERKISADLARLGVDRQLAKQVLEEARPPAFREDGAADMEAVITLARRRFGQEFTVDPRAGARRLTGFLARRGFDWDTIHAVARVLEQEAGGGGERPLP